jgi:hypothetical protein
MKTAQTAGLWTTGVIALAIVTSLAFDSSGSSEFRLQLYHDGTNTCFYLNGQQLPLSTLQEKFIVWGKISTSIRIPVRVCPDVPFRDVVAAVDAVQNGGFTNVTVEMRGFGQDISPAKVRLFLGEKQRYTIRYDGGLLQAVPAEE